MFNKQTDKIKRATHIGKKKLMTAIAAIGSSIIATGIPALAVEIAIDENTGMETVANGIVGTILDIFRWIGVILAIWGTGQLVLAFRNDDADSKTRAVMLIVAAIALIGLKTLLTAANFIN